MKAEILDGTLPACQLGEGPHWDEASGNLSWVDIKKQRIHLYNLATRHHKEIVVSQPVGFAIPQDDYFVAGLKDGIYGIGQGGQEKRLAAIPAKDNIRFNDGKCDSYGRLWAGTMNMDSEPEETGAFYRFADGVLTMVESVYAIPNGKAWNPQETIMYHVDTTRHCLWKYDYDRGRGTISNKQKFIQFNQDLSPDGICSDSEGCLYVALFGSGEIRIFNADGKQEGQIFIPVPNVTSCIIGGKNLRTLFVTTAYDGLSEEQLAKWPASGQIFTVSLDP